MSGKTNDWANTNKPTMTNKNKITLRQLIDFNFFIMTFLAPFQSITYYFFFNLPFEVAFVFLRFGFGFLKLVSVDLFVLRERTGR